MQGPPGALNAKWWFITLGVGIYMFILLLTFYIDLLAFIIMMKVKNIKYHSQKSQTKLGVRLFIVQKNEQILLKGGTSYFLFTTV